MPVDPKSRAVYQWLATGSLQPNEFFRDLSEPDSQPDCVSYVENKKQQVNTDSIAFSEADEIVPAANTSALDDPMSNEPDLEDDVDVEQEKEKYKEKYQKFEKTLFSNLKHKDFLKCFRQLGETFDSLSRSKYGTFTRKLYSFSHKESYKKGRRIPVQSTAIARRKAKIRGRSTYGTRVKDCALRSQLIVDGTSEDVVYSLPPQKPRSNKVAHSLAKAVNENRGSARKH